MKNPGKLFLPENFPTITYLTRPMDKHKVLYISYDGMTDPLGQSQVLAYLKILSQYEFSFHILSFEKKDRFGRYKSFVEEFIKDHDIQWHPLPYTNTPPVISTVNNIRKGKRKIKELASSHNFEIVHCRGYIPSVMGEWLKKRTGAKFIFDMRGWWPDEKKEAGDWNSPLFTPIYNYFKKREKRFFRYSDLSISLTHIGKEYITKYKLKSEDKVSVIPTCVNFEIFPPFDPAIRKTMREELKIPAGIEVMVYSGSLGGNYKTDVVLRFFKYMLEGKPDAMFLFISHSSAELVNEEIRKSGIDRDKFRYVYASYADVHRYLMAGDIGVVMYGIGFSVIGRSPTKLGEYWACGLKFLSVKGIGDLEYLMKRYAGGGSLVSNIEDEDDMRRAVKEVMEMEVSRDALRNFSIDYFDLGKGSLQYLESYRKLVNH